MSFDIVIRTCNLGDRVEERVNPFTGEAVSVPVDEHASDAERAAITQLIDSVAATSTGEPGGYVISMSHGELIELHLDEGCGRGAVGLRDVSPDVCDFLFRLADLGNYALTPIANDVKTLVTTVERADRVRSRWPETLVVSSGAEMERQLSGAVETWQQFRDQVVDADQPDPH